MDTYRNISDDAIEVFNNIFKGENIVFCKEILNHDGYNSSIGPESNLWDLYIINFTHDNYIIYNYHWEDWFLHGNQNKKKKQYEFTNYELCRKENLLNISNTYLYDIVNKYINETYDKGLKDAFKSINIKLCEES